MMKKITVLGVLFLSVSVVSLKAMEEGREPFPNPTSMTQAAYNSLYFAHQDFNQVHPALTLYMNTKALEVLARSAEAMRRDGIDIKIGGLDSAKEYEKEAQKIYKQNNLGRYGELLNKWGNIYLMMVTTLYKENRTNPNRWGVHGLTGDLRWNKVKYYDGQKI